MSEFPTRTNREHERGDLIDLVVLACRSNAVRCRVPGTQQELTLRKAVGDEVPGEIITVLPAKRWTYAKHPYLSGTVQQCRLDVARLDLVPLALHRVADWEPDEECWGEADAAVEDWAKAIVARGRRPMFEMEQVIPGEDPDDPDDDPILRAVEWSEAGYDGEAEKILMDVLAADLRCLDAHAHLGNLEFDWNPTKALRHYTVGVAIGGLTLGAGFDGVLSWGLIDNRPFLRCLSGVGLCLWRCGRTREAAETFRRMLWLNPSDNQGARFNLADIEAGKPWAETAQADA